MSEVSRVSLWFAAFPRVMHNSSAAGDKSSRRELVDYLRPVIKKSAQPPVQSKQGLLCFCISLLALLALLALQKGVPINQ
jgi:hypothetical protein